MTIQNGAAPAGDASSDSSMFSDDLSASREGQQPDTSSSVHAGSDGASDAARGDGQDPEFLAPNEADHPDIAQLKAEHLAKWRDERRKQADTSKQVETLASQLKNFEHKAAAFDNAMQLPQFKELLAKAATGEISAPTSQETIVPRRRPRLPETLSAAVPEQQVDDVVEIVSAILEQNFMPLLAPYQQFIEQQARGSAQTEMQGLEQKYGKELVGRHAQQITKLRQAGLSLEQALMAASNGQAAVEAQRRGASAPAAVAPMRSAVPLPAAGSRNIFAKRDEKTNKWTIDKAGLAAKLRALPGADALYR